MKDLYNELGIKEEASAAEIKSAYRSLARKHHPDIGGDEEKFKKISNAYDILKDPKKREEYRQQQDFERYQRHGSHSSSPFPHDINIILEEMIRGGDSFSNIHFGEGFSRRQYRQTQQNKDIKIRLTLSLEDIVKPQKKVISVTLASGQREIVEVELPAGIKNNSFIKYNGLGDNSISTEPRGDLYVNVIIIPHPIFKRINDDLVIHQTIDCIDAMLGTNIKIKTLDKRKLSVTINKGTQNGTVLKLSGEGLKISNNFNKISKFGDMHVVIDVNILSTLTKDQYNLLRQIKGQK